MSVHVTVTRQAQLPDEVRVARCRRAPELGPKIVFFSGGSALRPLSRSLKLLTHNSIHLVTPFDSGGSSAALRGAFSMLSVGDLRNRLMALADEGARGNPEVYSLVTARLPDDVPPAVLAGQLSALVDGIDVRMAVVPEPLRRLARTYLRLFEEQAPADFDLRGASLGNLMLAGSYLQNERDIDSVLFHFGQMISVRGTVRTVTDAHLHLAVTLADGSRVVGQHLITEGVAAPIQQLQLVHALDDDRPATAILKPYVQRFITSADLICFPMGSFFTSVATALLVDGVGRAVVDACCPKVYVPSTGHDPELRGLSLADTVRFLVDMVATDVGAPVRADEVVSLVLVDRRHGRYPPDGDLAALEAEGVRFVNVPLIATPASPPGLAARPASAERPVDGRIDPLALGHALISLV